MVKTMETCKVVLMEEVNSSNLRKVGHDGQDLFLEYSSGALYKYSDVPRSLYEELLTSESKGKFVNACVKGKYVFKRLK